MNGIVARGELHKAQTVPRPAQAEGLGIDGHDGTERKPGGNIAMMK